MKTVPIEALLFQTVAPDSDRSRAAGQLALWVSVCTQCHTAPANRRVIEVIQQRERFSNAAACDELRTRMCSDCGLRLVTSRLSDASCVGECDNAARTSALIQLRGCFEVASRSTQDPMHATLLNRWRHRDRIVSQPLRCAY